jgi:hypothetical protein
VARHDPRRHLPLLSSRPPTIDGNHEVGVAGCQVTKESRTTKGYRVHSITLTLRSSSLPQFMTRLALTSTGTYGTSVIGQNVVQQNHQMETCAVPPQPRISFISILDDITVMNVCWWSIQRWCRQRGESDIAFGHPPTPVSVAERRNIARASTFATIISSCLLSTLLL